MSTVSWNLDRFWSFLLIYYNNFSGNAFCHEDNRTEYAPYGLFPLRIHHSRKLNFGGMLLQSKNPVISYSASHNCKLVVMYGLFPIAQFHRSYKIDIVEF